MPYIVHENQSFYKRKMDIQILRAIVQSHGEVMREVEDPETFDRALVRQKFPPMDRTILAALTRSFTDLISYKVSPEAYQRYSVRIQVIEVLREWIRPTRELDCSRTFSQSERVLEFTSRLLRIYLTNELLYHDDKNIDVLVTLAKALICLIPKNKSFVRDLSRLLSRIGELDQTEESERLLICALEEKDSLELGPSTIENLYTSQRLKLIEEPLMENFVINLKNSTLQRDFKSSYSLDRLLEISIESPIIFHTTSSILKEIFVHSKNSPKVLDYVKYYLKSLGSRCQERKKNILDLYPIRLQAAVILLGIMPEQHTLYSQEHTIKCLEKIHFTNPEESLILLTHFPAWLGLLSTRLERNFQIENEHSFTSIMSSSLS